MNPSNAPPPAPTPLQIWAGVECTVTRVEDTFRDQLVYAGHDRRPDDLDRFAALGIAAIRYPVLWERTAPDGLDRADWRWADERLGRLRDLGIRPIVGLVHHGSGPRGADLLAPGFVAGLAAFAGAVAERYPWVDAYTPVNEPGTTARFSTLYGHWYPHRRDDSAFARAMLHQSLATAAAMRAVRAHNPTAQLVQTEDLGRTWSTPPLADQAAFTNERRWLGFDLLCGQVGPGHPLWEYLTTIGLSERDVAPLRDAPCPPDVIGVNHYLTSERYLDDRLDRYPAHLHGGNARQAYVDVEAVRARPEGFEGVGAVLREAWARYRIPVAVTEAHLGCTREEQVRWLAEVWRETEAARDDGVDARAVTVWSLLGAFDWNSLLTRRDDHYEPGVFDLRAPTPRPTALAAMVRDLASGRPPSHPVLAAPGWWRRAERFAIWPGAPERRPAETPGPPVLLVGDGPLVSCLARSCRERGLAFASVGSSAHVLSAMRRRPWAVILGSVLAPDVSGAWAAACAASGTALAVFSPDRVFDGAAGRPYLEDDPVSPRTRTGRLAAATERRVTTVHPWPLIVRHGPLFGTDRPEDPLRALLAEVTQGGSANAPDRAIVSPTFAPDLAEAVLDLLVDRETGVWHLPNPGQATWVDLLRRVADLAGREALVALEVDAPADRVCVALESQRGWPMPPLEDALARAVRGFALGSSVEPAA